MSEESESISRRSSCGLITFRRVSRLGFRLTSAYPKIRFTKHARDKFEFVGKYGFKISKDIIKETIINPSRLERRNDQLLALKPIDREYAIRVVYRVVNDNIVVVAFYPVKRERFRV